MTVASLPPPRAPRRRLLTRILGPRFIDPPLRFVTAFMGLLMMLPTDPEAIGDPATIAMSVSAGILAAASAYVPATVLALAAAGTVAVVLSHTDALNSFTSVVAIAAAVLCTYRRWSLWLATLGVLVGEMLLGRALGTVSGSLDLFTTTLVLFVLATALGLAAGFGEARIQNEIARREEAAQRHEQELQATRIDVAVDTHDTVSHGLATQAAIIRVLGQSAVAGDVADARALSELGMVNDRSQRQLRRLLTRLRGEEDRGASTDLVAELEGAAGAIRAGAVAGGFDLRARVEGPAAALPVPADLAEASSAMLYELATNIFKHARADAPCEIRAVIGAEQGSGQLLLEARSRALGAEPFTPRTLTRRSARLGGACAVEVAPDGATRVAVRIPLPVAPAAPEPAPGAAPDPSADLPRTDEASDPVRGVPSEDDPLSAPDRTVTRDPAAPAPSPRSL